MRAVAKKILFLALGVGLISCLAELLSYTLGNSGAYRDLPRSSPGRLFFDLYIWTSNLNGCNILPWELGGNNHCASELYPFNYPWYPIYFLRALGLSESYHLAGGFLVGLVGSCSYFWLSLSLLQETLRYKMNWRRASCVILAFWAGTHTLPWRYALERGQIDLLITGLVLVTVVSAFALRLSPKMKWNYMVCILAVAALTKIFPFFAAITVYFSRPENCLNIRRQKDNIGRKNAIMLGLGLILTAFLLIKPVMLTFQHNLSDLGGHGFGLKSLLNAGYASSFTFTFAWKCIVLVIGSMVGLSIIGIKGARITRLPSALRMPNTLSELTIQLFSSMIIPLYLLTESISYKFIFVVAMLPCLAAVDFKDVQADRIANLCFIAGICSIMSISLPFSPSLYAYVEWFVHFLLHPLLFGLLLSLWLRVSIGHHSDVEATHL